MATTQPSRVRIVRPESLANHAHNRSKQHQMHYSCHASHQILRCPYVDKNRKLKRLYKYTQTRVTMGAATIALADTNDPQDPHSAEGETADGDWGLASPGSRYTAFNTSLPFFNAATSFTPALPCYFFPIVIILLSLLSSRPGSHRCSPTKHK